MQVVYWTLYYKGRGNIFAMIFVNQNVVLESFGYCLFFLVDVGKSWCFSLN